MTERLSMRAIREILRQRWVQGQPHRAVALSTGRSVGAVYETLRRAADAGLDWERVQGMTDDALDAALYRRPAVASPRGARPQPDCVYLHTERRKPGVTLELLHLEYLERHPDGYRYRQLNETASLRSAVRVPRLDRGARGSPGVGESGAA